LRVAGKTEGIGAHRTIPDETPRRHFGSLPPHPWGNVCDHILIAQSYPSNFPLSSAIHRLKQKATT
jgi:hypothetical protein